jgi:two-component system OmpR family response regulator
LRHSHIGSYPATGSPSRQGPCVHGGETASLALKSPSDPHLSNTERRPVGVRNLPQLPKILTIEDDETTAVEIARELVGRGFEVKCVADGTEGLRLASTGNFDLVTLDRMLPGQDGLSIASALKDKGIDIPILMISALNDVDERVRGLRAGGDDYLTKPFSPQEMTARVEVLLRRASADARKLVLRYADLELDLVTHVARRGGRDLRLFPKEGKLLDLFLRNSEQVLTRTMIFEAVWGYSFDPGTNLIDVHIRALRRKLETPGSPTLLQTVRGTGYCLRAE